MFFMILLWVGSAFLCSYIAGQKNRPKGTWFLAGLFLGIFAIIAIVAVPALTNEERNQKEKDIEDSPIQKWY